jgi:uncharacterized protein YPO0396
MPTHNGHPALPGFRLKRLELLNWGTFHGKIERLVADCRWTLISGSNGTGKSTAADAIRTLLVPPSKLTYNDASLDQKLKHTRRDRTKKTYIRGAYGAYSQEDSATPIMQFHRQEGEQSIILAVFANEYTDVHVTLAQILWMYNDDYDQMYLIARQDRTINEHLTKLGVGRDVKRNLQTRGFETFQSFPGYETKFRSYLGIPGQGALDVFNQVIGVKEVTDLNSFIRRHLLEPSDTPKFIAEHLRPHFTQLSACWQAIQRAEAQLNLLRPIADRCQKLAEADKNKAELEVLKAALPFYYAQKEMELRIAQDEDLELEQGRIANEQAALQQQQSADDQQKQSLLDAIRSDTVGQRLEAIEREIEEARRSREGKQAVLARIRANLNILHQSPPLHTEDQFKAMRHKLLMDKGAVQGNLRTQDDRRLEAALGKRQAEDRRQHIAAEAESVRKNQVLIPHRLIEIRERICEDVNIKPAELPFAGELIEVKDEHKEWTGAIERLLHGVGISMLVPESLYPVVAKYINAAHLGTRLDFFRVPAAAPGARLDIMQDPRRVPSRLNFKTDSPLIRWVQAEVARRFDHFCCTDVPHLNQVEFGITREGLIRNGPRHTKDDSARINDRSSYVLGWNTQAKLAALLKEAETVTAQIREHEGHLGQIDDQIRQLRDKLTAIGEILKVEDFAAIDSKPEDATLNRLNDEKDRLSRSSNKIRELREELGRTQKRLDERAAQLEKLSQDVGGIKAKREETQRKMAKLQQYLKEAPADVAASATGILNLQEEKALTVDNLEDVKEAVERRVQNRLNFQTATINSARDFLLPAMSEFLAAYPEEKADLKAQLDFGPDFIRLKDTIENEKLPEHKQRFFSMLNRELILNLAAFNSKLTTDEKAIRTRIDGVNQSLRNIEFTTDTYVQVLVAPAKSDEIKSFRVELKGCLSGGIQPNEEQLKQIYERIQALITRFDKEPEWTARVTDVRNWLEYGVRRLSMQENTEVEYYAASSGKSGGQKSLLAFTILASAITAQYGLTGNGDDCDHFRLVVVDEIFGKTDEDFSQRALDLFKKLDLQLVIVNPFDAKSRIVEDYVHSYHLVSARDDISTMKRACRAEYEEARD